MSLSLETPRAEKSAEIGISSEKPAAKIDRRISVAPMMEGTDNSNFVRWNNRPRGSKKLVAFTSPQLLGFLGASQRPNEARGRHGRSKSSATLLAYRDRSTTLAAASTVGDCTDVMARARTFSLRMIRRPNLIMGFSRQ
jgi:hypothetical protein